MTFSEYKIKKELFERYRDKMMEIMALRIQTYWRMKVAYSRF